MIIDNQHYDSEECPSPGLYAAKKATGEILGYTVAPNEDSAYAHFEGKGIDLHYVKAVDCSNDQ